MNISMNNILSWSNQLKKNILDWPILLKSQILALSTGMTSLVLVLLLLLFNQLNLPQHHRFDEDASQLALIIFLVIAAFAPLIFALGMRMSNKAQFIQRYNLLCLVFYAICNAALVYYFGELSVLSGISVTGAVITGWILFDFRNVFITSVLFMIFSLLMYFLTFSTQISYAPLVPKGINPYMNASWVMGTFAICIPHISIMLFIAYISIRRWREREAAANYKASTDLLTGLYNRRSLIEQMDQAINLCQRHKKPISILLLDLDHFKHINDEHGHLVGDEVLRQVSACLQMNVESGDIVGRYGGEEFCIVLPMSNQHRAKAIASKCHQAISQLRVKHQNQRLKLTISIGLCSYDNKSFIHKDELARELMRTADDALYEAKRNGRNRVETASLNNSEHKKT